LAAEFQAILWRPEAEGAREISADIDPVVFPSLRASDAQPVAIGRRKPVEPAGLRAASPSGLCAWTHRQTLDELVRLRSATATSPRRNFAHHDHAGSDFARIGENR
jgi:hypothetical protein